MQDLPTAAVNAFEDFKRRFSNRRQWREFVSALQCSVNYSNVIGTLRSSTKWFSDELSRASGLTAISTKRWTISFDK
ncbi:MAG TPA: hypothetical protein VGD54_12100 [Steroidobacteraceae bacterium]